MKVLFINTLDGVGGAAGVVRELMDQLNKRGVDCKCLVGYKSTKDDDVEAVGKIFGPKIDFIIKNGINKVISNDIDLGVTNEIFNHPWYQEAEVVHVNNLHGGFFKLSNIIRIAQEKKLVWTFHDEWPIMAHGACVLDNKIRKGFFVREGLETYPSMIFDNANYLIKEKTRIYNNSEFVITTPSKWLKNLVTQTLLKSRDIKIIHNGIDGEVFKPGDKLVSRKRLGLPRDKKIILFVADGGVNNTWKGWKYVQEIVDKGVPSNWLFIIIGGEKEIISENIWSVGYIRERKKMAMYYAAADTMLMPSIVESFGNVAVEALACACPVVAFPVGVIPEVVYHKQNGYIAKYKNSDDLKSGIDWILANSDIVQQKEGALKVGRKYQIGMSVDEYLRIYNYLLKHE